MHLIHRGVIIKAPDYLTPEHATEVLTDVLAAAKDVAKERLARGAIDDLATMVSFSDFFVTEESPAKRRLDWLIAHPYMQLHGDDQRGWIVFDTATMNDYGAGRTAYAAIDAALAKEGV